MLNKEIVFNIMNKRQSRNTHLKNNKQRNCVQQNKRQAEILIIKNNKQRNCVQQQ